MFASLLLSLLVGTAHADTWAVVLVDDTTTTVPPTTTTVPPTTTTLPPTGQAAVDWTASMLAVWNCEESTAGSDIDNVEGDANNDLGVHGTGGVARDTALFRQGAKSCKFVDTDNDWADCADVSCGPDLDLGDAEISYGGWFYTDNDAGDRTVMSKSSSSVFRGFELQRESGSPDNSVKCRIGDASTFNIDTTAADSWPVSTWIFAVCAYNPANTSELAALTAASTSLSASNADVFANATTADFVLGTQTANVQADNVFIDGDAWGVTDVCRAASAGIDGSLVMCDAGTPANYLPCTTNSDCRVAGNTTAICDTPTVEDNCASTPCCVGQNVSAAGDCDLPACDSAAP